MYIFAWKGRGVKLPKLFLYIRYLCKKSKIFPISAIFFEFDVIKTDLQFISPATDVCKAYLLLAPLSIGITFLTFFLHRDRCEMAMFLVAMAERSEFKSHD